jgi:hypothetical protein
VDAVDIAQMVSGIAAAVAAIGSLLAVRQAADVQRRARWPHLTAMPRIDGQTGHMQIEIHNAGMGIATSTQFAAVLGTQIAEGTVGSTFIKPGESKLVRTMIVMGPEHEAAGVQPYGVLWCGDSSCASHVFSFQGEHTRWEPEKRKRGKVSEPKSCRDALGVACPDMEAPRLLSDRAYGCLLDGEPRVFRAEHVPAKRELFPDYYAAQAGSVNAQPPVASN